MATVDELLGISSEEAARQAPSQIAPRFPRAERELESWGEVALSGIPAAAQDLFGGLYKAIRPSGWVPFRPGEPAQDWFETPAAGLLQALGSPISLVSEPLGQATEKLTGSPVAGLVSRLAGALLAPQKLLTAVPKAAGTAMEKAARLYQSARSGRFGGVAGEIINRYTGSAKVQQEIEKVVVSDTILNQVQRKVFVDPLYKQARRALAEGRVGKVTAQPILDHLGGIEKQALSPAMQTSVENLITKIKTGATESIEGERVVKDIPFKVLDDSLKEVDRMIQEATKSRDFGPLRAIKRAIEDNMSLFGAKDPAALAIFNRARKEFAERIGPVLDRRELLEELRTDPSLVVKRLKSLSAEDISKATLPRGMERHDYWRPDVITGLPPKVRQSIERAVLADAIKESKVMNGPEFLSNMEAFLGDKIGTTTATKKLTAVFGENGLYIGRVLEKLAKIPPPLQSGIHASPWLGAHMTARSFSAMMGAAGAGAAGAGAYYGHPVEGLVAGLGLAFSPFFISRALTTVGGARMLDRAFSLPPGTPERAAITMRLAAMVRAGAAQEEQEELGGSVMYGQ